MTNSRSLILMDQYSQMTISIIEGRGLWALCPSLRCNWQFMAAGEGVPFSSVVEPLVSSSCFSKIIPCPWSSQQHREGFQISGRMNTIKILHTHSWSHQRLYCQIKYHWKSACAYFSIFYINYRFILKYFRRKWISPVQLGKWAAPPMRDQSMCLQRYGRHLISKRTFCMPPQCRLHCSVSSCASQFCPTASFLSPGPASLPLGPVHLISTEAFHRQLESNSRSTWVRRNSRISQVSFQGWELCLGCLLSGR